MSEDKYRDILSQMTLEEKASLCSGDTFWLTKAIDRLGVPAVWLSDGPNGIRKEKQGSATNVMRPAETATCFPTAVTLASSWDKDLIEEVGSAIAEEAHSLGVTTVLGPGVNIKRSPLCGRNFEYLSEDPFLAGRMGAAYVHGVQKNGIGVSVKHFCANDQEHLRMCIDSVVDERTLREIYLPAFEHIVKTEQPATIMSSYNRLNGTYLSDNRRMLTEILREEWGFKGIVVSDWGGMNDRVESIKAGNDLEMPGNGGMNDRNIIKAVKAGKLSEEDLDRVVYRMIKFAFERKANETTGPVAFDKHHAVARKAAANGAVLLKNDGGLPVKDGATVAVIGTLAKEIRYQGSGSSHINVPKTVSFTEALEENGKEFVYAPGYSLKGDGYNAKLIEEAKNVARGKDVVLLFIGLTDVYESEGFDRTHMKMPSSHELLATELVKVNPNVVVVLSGGSPVELGSWKDDVKSILNLYLGGQAGGEGAYDVIYGLVNPSGKLAETFPVKNEDSLASKYFPMGPRSVEYRESVYVGYRYFDKANKEVAYPFGHGLSYTKFEYSDISVSANEIKEGTPLIVKCTVSNVGQVAGAEVVELYVADKESTIYRPVKELKGFKKVYIEPGKSREVEFVLDSRAFAYYNTEINDWHIESGEFDILVGASSRDIRLTATVNVLSARPEVVCPDYREITPSYYTLPEEGISAEEYEKLLGRPLEGNAPFRKGELTINNSVEQCAVNGFGKFLLGVLVFGSKIVAIGTENPDMITRSVRDMPLRSFSGFTGGIVSQWSVSGLLDMCNGTKGGFKKLLQGFTKKYQA